MTTREILEQIKSELAEHKKQQEQFYEKRSSYDLENRAFDEGYTHAMETAIEEIDDVLENIKE